MDTLDDERRTFDRYSVQDASVKYVEDINMGIFKKYSGEFPMMDISQSGVRIEVDKLWREGQEINLMIDIPGHAKIQIRGNIQWIQEYENPIKYEAGVLFLPFGSSKEYNSFRAKNRLDHTIKKLVN